MKMKYTSKPTYPEVDVVGKTTHSECGTIDRRKIGRLLITETAGFGPGEEHDDKIVLDGDETPIQSVEKVDEIEVVIRLVDDQKSAASFKFFDAYTAKNKENPEVTDVFTTNGEQVDRAVACAERMCVASPGCDGQYEFLNKASGKRVFLRQIVKTLTPCGMVDERGE